MYHHFLVPTRLESWHPWSSKATWTNTTRKAKSTTLKGGISRKRHKLGYGRIVVAMLVNIFILLLFWTFSYSLMQFPPSILKISTQHPPNFFKLSTQHQPAITRIENWAILPTQGLQFSYTLICAFSKLSAYTKTVHFYSTKNTSMNKFLAQSSSPCLMLGGIPPASLSEGWCWRKVVNTLRPRRNEQHFADNTFKHIFVNENMMRSWLGNTLCMHCGHWWIVLMMGPSWSALIMLMFQLLLTHLSQTKWPQICKHIQMHFDE